jgi:hypothetical protein
MEKKNLPECNISTPAVAIPAKEKMLAFTICSLIVSCCNSAPRLFWLMSEGKSRLVLCHRELLIDVPDGSLDGPSV